MRPQSGGVGRAAEKTLTESEKEKRNKEMRILTLCEDCAGLYGQSYAVKKIPYKTTTQKQPACEHCRKHPRDGLFQWAVTKEADKV